MLEDLSRLDQGWVGTRGLQMINRQGRLIIRTNGDAHRIRIRLGGSAGVFCFSGYIYPEKGTLG